MPSIVQPTEEELEALLAIAATPPTKEELIETDPNVSSIEDWVIACGVKIGKTPMLPVAVWYYYRKWAKKPMRRAIFFKKFKSKFGHVLKYNAKISPTKCYYLNEETFPMAHTDVQEINQLTREFKQTQAQAQYGKKVAT